MSARNGVVETFGALLIGRRDALGTINPKSGAHSIERTIITDETILRHLDGRASLGSFPLWPPDDDTDAPVWPCRWGCIDLDIKVKDGKGYRIDAERLRAVLPVARALVYVARRRGVTLHIERTKAREGQPGGGHLWMFAPEPVPADAVIVTLREILRDTAQTAHGADLALFGGPEAVEIFPKQPGAAHLKDKLGNFVDLPLFGATNGTKERHFVDITTGEPYPDQLAHLAAIHSSGRTPVSALSTVEAPKPASAPTAKRTTPPIGSGRPSAEGVAERLRVAVAKNSHLSKLWNDHNPPDRSKREFRFTATLIELGWAGADVEAALLLLPGRNKAVESGRADYLAGTVEKAQDKVAAAVLQKSGEAAETPQEEKKPLRAVDLIHAATSRDFVAKDWPQRPELVGPWMRERSITTMFSEAGVGKTQLAMSLALSLASGVNLLAAFGWRIPPQPVDVLYVDGELPAADIVERLRLLYPWELPERLHILSDDAHEGLPSLATDEGRELIDRVLTETGSKVLILDNMSCLLTGLGDHNSAESWDMAQLWLIGLRRRGLAVLTLDHAGKTAGRGPRGTSRKLDVVDAAIELARPDGITTDDGCRFRLSWKKARMRFDRSPYSAWLEEIEDDNGDKRLGFKARLATEETRDAAVRMNAEGAGQAEIMEELNISRATYYRYLPGERASGKRK